MPTPTPTPAPPLPPAPPLSASPPLPMLPQVPSPPPPVGVVGSYLPPPPPPYVIPGFPPPIAPPLPPALPPPVQEPGVIQVRIDNEWIPIQSGASGSHTTAWISVSDLLPGTYTIYFHGRRSDQSEVIVPVSLVVESPAQGIWGLPQIATSSLPAGYVGKEYSDLKYATLTTGSDDKANQLKFTAVIGGATGNSITLTYSITKDGDTVVPSKPLLVSVTGLNITVNLATNSLGGVISTSENVKNAIRNNASASALVTVTVIGNPIGTVETLTQTPLAGGAAATTSLESDPPDTAGIWSVTPGLYGTSGLPPGLSFDAATGAVFGIPTQVGNYVVSFHLIDNQGYQVTRQIPLTIFSDRPAAEVLPTETRALGLEIYPDEPVISGSLATPLPDQISQDLLSLRDLKRSFWSPVPLTDILISDGEIISSVAISGQLSTAVIQFEPPVGPGPWVEVRFSFYSYKDPANPDDIKIVLAIIPMSGGVALRDTVEKTTLPLDGDSTYLHQFVWRGLWFREEVENLAIRFEPRSSLPVQNVLLGANKVRFSGVTATLRSVPLPDVSLVASVLLSGKPVSAVQLTPYLSDEFETYELTWLGHWDQNELEEISLILETRVKSEEMDSDAAIPWVMVSSVELEASPEPPPVVPVTPGEIPNLLTVTVVPSGAADLDGYVFLVNVKSNGYDGWVIPSLSWVNTNPGISAVFSEDRISITNGEVKQIQLTVTNVSAAIGSVAYFVVLMAASTGIGSGSSGPISFIVADAPPSALPLPPSSIGSTQFFVDLTPTVAEIPTYGFTSFAVKVTAPLGTTTVALSASVRPFLSSVQAAFTASVVQPAPGYPVTTQLQVQVTGVPEQTYSVDILGIGSDGGYAGAQAVLVVKGQPVAPVPLPPPLPVSPPLAYPGIVETLVPDGTINQTGTLSGNWPDISSGVGDDSADDSTYVQFLFGPSPLTGVAAVNYSMTDPVADGIWTQIILRARLRILTNVQNPTFSFQPYVNDLPVGSAKTISIQDGLSINIQIFAWTWQGQWTTNELRTLMVQVSAYTTGSQVELNEIVLTELDAVIAGNLRNPLPVSVPVHLAPNSLGTTSGASWGYSTLNLISAVNQDTDCATDLDYATIDLVSGGNSHQEFNFEDPPIEGSWREITVRVRAQATGGQPQIEIDFTIRGATVIGSVVPITGEDWVTYRAVYAGTYDNSDISGMTVNVKLSNIGGGSSEVLVSGVDVVVQGVAAALEQIKIVPFYELQFYGSHHGSIADIWEGLVWPPDASTDPNLPLVAAGDFITSPDPLPKEYDPEEVDLDYEVFPLNYDQRSTIIEYGFSDPVPIPSLLLPPGSPPLPSLPPGPPPVVLTLAIKDASLLLPPSPPGSPPTVPGDLSIKDADLLLPPSPPGSPPTVPGELLIRTASMLPPPPPAVEQYFTSVTVRMRLHQDPRIGPPAIINIPPEPPFTLVEPAPLSLPPAPVNQLFPFSGHPLQFQVTGGTPPYAWFTYIVPTIGANLAGVPSGIDAAQDPDDSSLFDYLGTPDTVGIYQFGITVNDFKGRGISWSLTHEIVVPGPPPSPPPPGPPPGPVSPPVVPPVPPSPPLAPPVPDMFLWIDNYTIGINPIEDPTTDWVAPDVDINSLPPSDLNHVNVSQVQFETPTQTIELSGGDLTELAHLTRSGLTWTTVVFSNRGLGFGPVVTIKGATSADPAPTGITHDATIPFTVVLTFNGVAGLPESGSVEFSVTGVPNALNQPSPPGGASGTIYWAFLSPLVILTSHLPDVVVGSAYSETLAAQGGTQPYTWYLTSSTNSELPPGITLSTDGKLTGKPYQVGNYVFQVAVFDSKRQITTANLSINVTPPVPLPPPPPPPGLPPVLPPVLPPGVPPAPPGPPGPPIFVIEEVPGIEVRFQPLVPGKCSGTIAGLGSTVINDFLIPRPSTGSTAPVSAGPWKDFSQTWFGFWTSEQLSELMVEVQISLVEPISVGAQNNLYISALDVVVTKAVPPSMAPWLASMRPEGRIKWMSTRLTDETGMNSGKWFDQDTLTWQGAGTSYMNSILGTAHKGGATQEAADALLERFEILGWLDRDGSGTANAGDTPDFSGYVALATGIGTLDTTVLVTNISGLKDSLGKYFLGFLIDDELIVVQRDQIDYETGLLHNVWRGVNETREATHSKGTLVFPVNFWELVYQIKVAGASGPDFQGQAVGWDASSGNDDGTPGELLQSGPLDLRPFSGEHPIRWLLRLRAFDIYGLNTDSNMDLPGYPDEFKSTGPGAYMGPDGNVYVPTKRLLYVKQIRPPGKPTIFSSGV